MKKKNLMILVAGILACAMSFQSCIGSFSLTNKVLSWNKNVNNKFVNELVFFAFWVLPVYEVTAVADLLVINSIEFWSGNNPLEASNQVIETEHGNYQILASESGYDVLTPDGNKMRFIYDSATSTWSFAMNDNAVQPLIQFVDEDHARMLDSHGDFVDVEISQDGVDSYVQKLNGYFLASI